MSPTYKQNKSHIYNWQHRNVERSRELKKITAQRYYAFKREQTRLCRILLDDFSEENNKN